jgi:hypothetical protein
MDQSSTTSHDDTVIKEKTKKIQESYKNSLSSSIYDEDWR